MKTEQRLRAIEKDKPVDAAGVEHYLAEHLGPSLESVRTAMPELATSFTLKRAGPQCLRPLLPLLAFGAQGDARLERQSRAAVGHDPGVSEAVIAFIPSHIGD
jgi:hypothetical protein